MGFNTAILILNDCLNEIDKDPERFALNLTRAIKMSFGEKKPYPIGIGQAQVIYQEHADSLGILAVGGNTGSILGYVPGRKVRNDGSEDAKLAILKELSRQEGYYLHKKYRRPKK